MSNTEKIFEALSSTTRRKILSYLSESPLPAGDIAKRFDMSAPAISKHLSILEASGLVWKRREGQFVLYGMEQDNLSGTLLTYLQEVCPVSRNLKSESSKRVGGKKKKARKGS